MSWIGVAGVLGFLGVALGAFGAHGLRGRVPEPMLAHWQTATLYLLVHAVALLAIGAYGRATAVAVGWPAALFLAGVVLFSGSLYVLVLTGVPRLGMVTPLGGLSLLAGWLAVVVVLGRS
ncbi:MAG: DUF423 domain-containing protein [Polyangiaceae bacterium]|nr:DUF423 domain-containing protein [Polyangiaceae bacterium]